MTTVKRPEPDTGARVTTGTRTFVDPQSATAQRNKALFTGYVLGGATFVLMSYVLHCHFGMGPWPCQTRKGQKSGFSAMRWKRK